MLKVSLPLVLTLLIGASTAQAATMVDFVGATNGEWATASAVITLNPDSLSFTGTLTNTSPYDAHITAFGFDIGDGNLNGYEGSPDPIIIPLSVNFEFSDEDLGNLPAGFNAIELDFGYLTGNNFTGGNVRDGLDYNETVSFVISGDFAGLTEAEIAAGMLVRFQRVGPNGEGSDLGVTNTAVPEPASMLLVGGGLMYLARRRMRREPVKA